MSEVVNDLSKKRYDEIRRTVIADSFEIVLNTIAQQTEINEKDKTFTNKKLTKTIELMQKLLCESNNERIPPEIIKTIKPKISAQLNNAFCFKPALKNNDTKKEKFDDIPVIFSPNISSALEISYNEVKIEDIKSREIDAHFHFFIFPLVIDGKEYVITYAEENKYSKRKIIEVLYNNIKVDESIITQEIRNKYNFY